MKGTKLIAGALVAGMMLTGAGYAYWTDQVTVTNTVSTGELNVKFNGATLTTTDADSYLVLPQPVVTNKSISTSATNLYPGSSFNFTATLENDGTIPAVLDAISVTAGTGGMPSGMSGLTAADFDKFNVSGTLTHESTVHNIPAGVTLAQLQAAINSFELRLEPGEVVTLDLTVGLKSTVVDADNLEKKYIKLDWTIDFKQHNAN